MKTPNAMIFAAGKGTRMGAMTKSTPKPLLQAAGRPLINHALDLAQSAGCQVQVVNLHTHADQLRAHLRDKPNVKTVFEPELLETGGGLKAALPELGEGPVFTLNTDAVWTNTNAFQTLAEAWDPDLMSALLLLVPPDRAHGHKGSGDFTLCDDGQIIRPGPMIYTGAQLIDPSGLREIDQDKFSLNIYWRILAETGRLFGVEYSGDWADAGTPEGLRTAGRLWESRHV